MAAITCLALSGVRGCQFGTPIEIVLEMSFSFLSPSGSAPWGKIAQDGPEWGGRVPTNGNHQHTGSSFDRVLSKRATER